MKSLAALLFGVFQFAPHVLTVGKAGTQVRGNCWSFRIVCNDAERDSEICTWECGLGIFGCFGVVFTIVFIKKKKNYNLIII